LYVKLEFQAVRVARQAIELILLGTLEFAKLDFELELGSQVPKMCYITK